MSYPNTQLPRLLTEQEVATLLQVTPGCLRHWHIEKRGPAFRKLGSLIRYDADDLALWLKASHQATKNGDASE